MNDQLLQRFQTDEHLRNEVIAFIDNFIQEEAIRRVFDRKDVSAVADAKEIIDRAFSDLEDKYGIKDKANKSVNQAK